MLDYRFIKNNLEAVKQNIINRAMHADAEAAVRLFDERTEMVTALQGLQAKRNENSLAMKKARDAAERNALIETGKAIKTEIAAAEAALKEKEAALDAAMMQIPNMAHPDAPIGKEDTENCEVKRVGEIPQFDFEPKDHVQLAEALDLIDFDAATKVSGVKFYYLKNEAVFLEQALVLYGLNIMRKHGFTPFFTGGSCQSAQPSCVRR